MRFRVFKWSVYGLLALNTVLFLLYETLVEGLEPPRFSRRLLWLGHAARAGVSAWA